MEKISLIICSRISSINSRFSQNIADTIGCEYEIITVDNSASSFSIFQAYNIGLNRCKGSLICFMHDDIFLNTPNWGKIIIDIFKQDPDVGLLGIAGGENKTKMPSAWWDVGPNHVKVIQHYKNKPQEFWNKGFNGQNLVEVAAIDGVFMVMKADARIRFDERLQGFHNYDLLLSLLHQKLNKKVVVTSEILLEHFSEGNLNTSWYKSTSKFHRLYKDSLPLYVGNLSPSVSELKKKEILVGYRFIQGLVKEFLLLDALYWWWRLFRLKPFSKYHLRILNKIFSTIPLKQVRFFIKS